MLQDAFMAEKQHAPAALISTILQASQQNTSIEETRGHIIYW